MRGLVHSAHLTASSSRQKNRQRRIQKKIIEIGSQCRCIHLNITIVSYIEWNTHIQTRIIVKCLSRGGSVRDQSKIKLKWCFTVMPDAMGSFVCCIVADWCFVIVDTTWSLKYTIENWIYVKEKIINKLSAVTILWVPVVINTAESVLSSLM